MARVWGARSGLVIAGLVASTCTALAGRTAPPPGQPLPSNGAVLARSLARTHADLHRAIDGWLKSAKPSASPTAEVTLDALYEQRIFRALARNDALASRTFLYLPKGDAGVARDIVAAHRELFRITPPIPASAIRVGAAEPAGVLLSYYREAERRFGVPWRVLAAVNFVESAFGKVRNRSATGAQGPMQFMPATWRAYGLGGDVHDPHDAILGAANYLRASGAPRSLRRALFAYNPHPAYVDAILRYVRVLTRDRRAFYELYSWQVFVRTPSGDRRVTGP